MLQYSQIERLGAIVKIIHEGSYFSKDEILIRLERDYDIRTSLRTLERDFYFLETRAGIPINYCRSEKGYYIEKESESQVILFLQFSGRILLGKFFQGALKGFGELRDMIKPEEYFNYEGTHLIEPILMALRNREIIRFTHYNFKKDSKTKYTITPFQLREYDRRWYVVGLPEQESHIKTFGLSRISELETIGMAEASVVDYENQLEKFNRIVGLNYDGSDKEEIVRIAVTKHQYQYLRSLPLHPTQTFEKFLPDGRVVLMFTLIPNYELKMQFLKMGDQIEVLEPKFLREKIRRILHNGLRLYEEQS